MSFTEAKKVSAMRILGVSHLFPHADEPRYGIFVARQLQAMSQAGADVQMFVARVFCPPGLRHLPRWQEYNHRTPLAVVPGVTTHIVPYLRITGNWFNRWSGLSIYLSMRRKVKQLHALNKFDVVYSTSLFPGGDAGIRIGKTLGIPSACLSIGRDVNYTANSTATLRKHFQHVARSIDGHLACGESLAQQLDGINGERALRVYGVVDLERFVPVRDKRELRSKLKLPREATILLYVGYLWRAKGLFELLKAFEDVRQKVPSAELVFCGHGPEGDELRSVAAQSQFAGAIHFAGQIEPDQVAEYMQASDLFAFPSHSEGMPNAVMEAMACGLPVVCTSVGGLPAAIGDCGGALLVPPKQPEQLAAALLKVLLDPSNLREMGDEARRRAEIDFGALPNARKILNYLAEVRDRSR